MKDSGVGGKELRRVEAHVASWVAGAYEDCRIVERGSRPRKEHVGFQHRPVTCRSAVDGSELPDAACAGLPPPRRWRRCDCGVVVCKPGEEEGHFARERWSELGAAASGSRDVHFSFLGCLSPNQDAPARSQVVSSRDESCITWKDQEGTCRLGLPFYRWDCTEADVMSPQLCFQFCLGKGLDLFGLLGSECRCGASALNRQAWRWGKPRAGLTIPWEQLGAADDAECARIYRYTGHFEAGGSVPDALQFLTEDDLAYLDSLAIGEVMTAEEEEDVPRSIWEAEVEPSGKDLVALQTTASRNECPVTGTCPCSNPDYPCYAYYSAGDRCACFRINGFTTPENCASFGGTFCGDFSTTTTTTTTTTSYTGPPTTSTTAADPPAGQGWSRASAASNPGRRWPERRSDPPGNTEDVWDDYVVIRYAFNASIDDTRKDAFRNAVTMWRETTCVNFIEEETPARPYVLIGIWDTGSCYANLGFSTFYNSNSYARINLGWCNDARHTGNMAHELGHILGMNHEQKRPDGPESYYGKGPYLNVFWENIPSSWTSQYTPSASTYTGSVQDFTGDPQVGYAQYDFESIMHYGGGSRYDTIPAEAESRVGQRSRLSEGDITQILDVYECRSKLTTTTTTIATTTTATTTTTITTTTTTTTATTTAAATTTSTAALFVPVNGDGVDQVCRGANAGDNQLSYFTVKVAGSLEQCKEDCASFEPPCVGIEYNFGAGRCEIWTRSAGIGATATSSGYTCLRYLPNAPSTTTTTTIDPALFRGFQDDGSNQVCRGSGPGDNLAEYFTATWGVESLSACQAECLAVSSTCKGIEFNEAAGRCEVWIRPEGIEATVASDGYRCLVYVPNLPTTTTVDPSLFQPILGDGTGQVCRGDSIGDNLGSYFTVINSLDSIEECKASCVQEAGCKGIEYHTSGRCEVWTRPDGIGTTMALGGYTCLRYVPELA
eukprot:s2710_g11.t1